MPRKWGAKKANEIRRSSARAGKRPVSKVPESVVESRASTQRHVIGARSLPGFKYKPKRNEPLGKALGSIRNAARKSGIVSKSATRGVRKRKSK